MLYHGKGNNNHQLGTGFFMHKRIKLTQHFMQVPKKLPWRKIHRGAVVKASDWKMCLYVVGGSSLGLYIFFILCNEASTFFLVDLFSFFSNLIINILNSCPTQGRVEG